VCSFQFVTQYSRLGKPAKLAIFLVGPALRFGKILFWLLENSRKDATVWWMNGPVVLRPISLAHIQVQMTSANEDKCSLEAGTKKTSISLEWNRSVWQYYCFMFYYISYSLLRKIVIFWYNFLRPCSDLKNPPSFSSLSYYTPCFYVYVF
jgi:hypothetical protein